MMADGDGQGLQTEQMGEEREQPDLSHYTNATSDDGSLCLGTTHTTQASCNKNLWIQYCVL